MRGLMGDRFLKWFAGNLLRRRKYNPPITAGIKLEPIKGIASIPDGNDAEANRGREEIGDLEPKESLKSGTEKKV